MIIKKNSNDSLEHSWGTSPKQKAKEKSYNHEYWEKNKEKILARRQSKAAYRSQTYFLDDPNMKDEIKEELGGGPLRRSLQIADYRRDVQDEVKDWNNDFATSGESRRMARFGDGYTYRNRQENAGLVEQKHAAERAAAPAKQNRGSSNLITDSGTHANTPISKMNASVRQNGKDAIDRILKLQKDKVK